MNSPALRQNGTSLWRWLFLFLMAAHALVVLAAPHPPILQDYPDWVYQGVLFARRLAHHPVPGYVLHHYPVPNTLTTVGIALLTLAVGWQLAAKLWILLVLASGGWAALLLVQRMDQRNAAVLPVLASTVFLGLDLWNGSINFQLSLALLLFLLVHLLKPHPSLSVTGILLLLCFFTHMLPCAAGLLALAALAIQQRKWLPLLSAVPTLICLAWYTLARDRQAVPSPSPLHLLPALLAVIAVLLSLWRVTGSSPALSSRAFFGAEAFAMAPTLLVIKCGVLLGSFGPGNVLPSFPRQDRILWHPGLFLTFAAAGILAAILTIALFLRMWAHLRKPQTHTTFLGYTSLALALLFLLLPADALGVTGIDVRFLHLALALGLPLLPPSNPRWLLTLGVLSSLLGAGSLYQFIAVQFDNASISLPRDAPFPLGTLPVAPAIRLDYYTDLQHGKYNDWIFPTALFGRSTP